MTDYCVQLHATAWVTADSPEEARALVSLADAELDEVVSITTEDPDNPGHWTIEASEEEA